MAFRRWRLEEAKEAGYQGGKEAPG